MIKFKDYEIYISISNKFEIYSKIDDNANKFVDNNHIVIYQLLWFVLTIINTDYNKYIHCILDEDTDYHNSQNHLIKILIEVLKISILKEKTMFYYESDYIGISNELKFNYKFKENGHLIFYITGPKHWFTIHNLGVITQERYPDCYMTEDEINYYFPIYNRSYILEEIKDRG